MRLFNTEISILPDTGLSTRSGGSLTSDLKDPTEWMIRALAWTAQSATGIVVTPLKALGVACVFGCVRVLSDTISTLPLEVRQRQGRRIRVATEHPLYPVLSKKPNGEMSSKDWRWAVQANLSLQGVGYSEIIRDKLGLAVGVNPVETSRVDFYRDPKSKRLTYRVIDTGDSYGSQDVLHLKGTTVNGLTSLNTTLVARECIALALAMQDNAAKFFGNGSRPNGVLKHSEQLSTEAQERLKSQFESQASGQNLYRLLLLEEGLEYVATRSENKDSQFLESKDSQNLEICRIFGVPPHKLGIQQGSNPRANIEEENLAFVMDRIRPLCVGWEMEMDTKLFTQAEMEAGYHTYFDIDAIMRGNMVARFDTYATARQWGIYTSNDCRVKEGMDEVDGGDVLLQPTNMIDASKATEFLMKAGQQAGQSEGGAGGKPNKK